MTDSMCRNGVWMSKEAARHFDDAMRLVLNGRTDSLTHTATVITRYASILRAERDKFWREDLGAMRELLRDGLRLLDSRIADLTFVGDERSANVLREVRAKLLRQPAPTHDHRQRP